MLIYTTALPYLWVNPNIYHYASAILQLDSTTQGMLPPRMTTTQRDAIATPAQGLVIYNTDTNFYNYWNSTSWIPLSAGGSSTLIDADSDTQIQVEESTDEDVIRFDVAGTQKMEIGNNGIGITGSPSTNANIKIAFGDPGSGIGAVPSGEHIVTYARGIEVFRAYEINSTTTGYQFKNRNGRMFQLKTFSGANGDAYADFDIYGGGESATYPDTIRFLRGTDNGRVLIMDGGSTKFNFTTSNGRLWIAGSLTQNSDIRLKDNIMPLTGVLPKLMQLSGNRYTWRDRPDGGTQIGLLAQEVEAQFPELVSTNTNTHSELEETKAVSYTNFTAVLLEGIKELNQKVKALEARVAELERE